MRVPTEPNRKIQYLVVVFGDQRRSAHLAWSTTAVEGDVSAVKLLDFLERSVERVIHSPIDSLFRQELQPAEIEKRLERAMLDNSRRASGSTIMPNHYIIQLNQDDYNAVEPYLGSLERRLETWLAERAAERDGTLLDQLQIEILPSIAVRRRRPDIAAKISDIQSSRPRGHEARKTASADHTQMFSVVQSRASVSLRLLTGANAGQNFAIDQGHTILGRSRDVDIRVDSLDVSRKHIRIDRNGDSVRLTDLNSTNGTRVNGEPVRETSLRNGDEILVGTQTLRLVIEP